MDVEGSSGDGNILIYYCEDAADQSWFRPDELEDGDFYSYVNKQSGLCIDVAGAAGVGEVATWACDELPD